MTTPTREADTQPASRGREALLAAAACATGAILAVYAAGRTWATVTPAAEGTSALHITGQNLTGTAALGWAALASLAALAATRGRARIAVGTVLILLGAAIGWLSFTATGTAHVLDAATELSPLFDPRGGYTVASSGAWQLLSTAGGVITALAGALTALRGHRWPGMSARYDRRTRPAADAPTDDPTALWKSLDRGEDPTDREEH